MTASHGRVYTHAMDNALIARGGVPVELDRTRILFFDKTAAFNLIDKYGEAYLSALYGPGTTANGRPTVKLKNIDALEYFLWAGLQYEAHQKGEQLALETVGGWVMPSTTIRIFDRVLLAITRDIHTPPLLGKDQAATASPAAAAKKSGRRTASTSRKLRGSRSRNWVSPKKSSGRRR